MPLSALALVPVLPYSRELIHFVYFRLTRRNRYWPAFSRLTLPLKAFFITSTTTAYLIISADRASRQYEKSKWTSPDQFEEIRHSKGSNLHRSTYQQIVGWARDNRYKIVGVSWVASMAISLGLTFQNRYLTFPQKLVQARMYAQGLTLAVLMASAGLYTLDDGMSDAERNQGDDEVIRDPNDPEHPITVHHKHKESYSGENYWETLVAEEEAREKRQKSQKKSAVKAKDNKADTKESKSDGKSEKTDDDDLEEDKDDKQKAKDSKDKKESTDSKGKKDSK